MIPYSKQKISEKDLIEVGRVMQSAFLTQGPEVVSFEEKLKEKFSVNDAVACSSGTAALHLSYASIGVNEQTIGIVPAITFSATANAFRYLGAEVQFCDVNPDNGLICLDSLEIILKEANLEEFARA
jgi:dTDP-4-amino-4,6-dideoxygalactose transaminase